MKFDTSMKFGNTGEPIAEDYGATEPMFSNAPDIGPTEPSNEAFRSFEEDDVDMFSDIKDYDQTAPGGYRKDDIPNYDNIGETERSEDGFGPTVGDDVIDDYRPTETIYANRTRGFAPVVGWLVCIDGPDKGRDYRIHSGYNTIGRAPNMDICISGDVKISRNKHAMIAFDPDESVFFFGPMEAKNLVKKNGKLVMTPMEIQGYDVLTIGTSKFTFIPFCGEKFSWEES